MEKWFGKKLSWMVLKHRAANLRSQMANTWLNEDEDVEGYIIKLKSLTRRINEAEGWVPPKPNEQNAPLPPISDSYDEWVVNKTSNGNPNLSDLTKELKALNVFKREKALRRSETMKMNNSFFSKEQRNVTTSKPNRDESKEKYCEICRKAGHWTEIMIQGMIQGMIREMIQEMIQGMIRKIQENLTKSFAIDANKKDTFPEIVLKGKIQDRMH